MKLRNVSVHTLEVPALGRLVGPGEVVDVPAGIAKGMKDQAGVWLVVAATKQEEGSDGSAE